MEGLGANPRESEDKVREEKEKGENEGRGGRRVEECMYVVVEEG